MTLFTLLQRLLRSLSLDDIVSHNLHGWLVLICDCICCHINIYSLPIESDEFHFYSRRSPSSLRPLSHSLPNDFVIVWVYDIHYRFSDNFIRAGCSEEFRPCSVYEQDFIQSVELCGIVLAQVHEFLKAVKFRTSASAEISGQLSSPCEP